MDMKRVASILAVMALILVVSGSLNLAIDDGVVKKPIREKVQDGLRYLALKGESEPGFVELPIPIPPMKPLPGDHGGKIIIDGGLGQGASSMGAMSGGGAPQHATDSRAIKSLIRKLG